MTSPLLPILAALKIVLCLSSSLFGEFEQLNSAEKIKRINQTASIEDPSEIGEAIVDLSLGLSDGDQAVVTLASQASLFFIVGLQESSLIERGEVSLSRAESDDFQISLIRLLNSEVRGVRINVSTALVYSTPPSPETETFFVELLQNEPSDEVKGALLEAMTKAGYRSEVLNGVILELLEPSKDLDGAIYARNAVEIVKPLSIFPELAERARKENYPQSEVLLALAAFDGMDSELDSVLNDIVSDENQKDEVVNLAKVILADDLNNRKKAESKEPRVLKLKKLWPTLLSSTDNKNYETLRNSISSSEFSRYKLEGGKENKAQDDEATPGEKQASKGLGAIVLGIVVVLGFIVLLLQKIRKRDGR